MSDAEETPDGQSESPLDTLVSRHRKESKELQARITAIKKQAGGDKKKKKETADQIASLEDELKKRHAKEKADLEAEMASKAPEPSSVDNLASLSLEDKEDDEHDDQQISTDPKKKRNRQKERKERKAAELEAARLEAAEEAKNLPNWKKLEDDALRKMVEKDELLLKEIAADGHCLYNAVGDQVGGKSYKELRKAAAEHMREHKDDYLPFMTDQNGDMLDDAGFEAYLTSLTTTPVWGGDLEIRALSSYLSRPIKVYQQHAPVLTVGEEFAGEPIRVSYHRHQLALGAHYNSLRKKET